MTCPSSDYAVRGASHAEAAGTAPEVKNDESRFKRQQRRGPKKGGGHAPSPGAPPAAGAAGPGAATLEGPPEPVTDDSHVDYYI
jgi:hypothetical protein